MKKFEYDVSIESNSQSEADRKMTAVMKILPKLTTEELEKIAKIVNDPFQLALIKTKL
ncbi:MAG: hypothetical protein Q8L81_05730 [Bacteroidota bacterium]|nr:hypothetical protein [Bacteroidota bacterium]